VNSNHGKRTQRANGDRRWAHYGREEKNLRAGTSSSAGRSELLQPGETKRQPGKGDLPDWTAASEKAWLTRPVPATHVERWTSVLVQEMVKAATVSRNMPASHNAWNHNLYNSSLISYRAGFD
jgi:hypothetical protein